MSKGIILGTALIFGATQASPHQALADWARDTADLAAKVMTATSSGAQFNGSEIAVTDQVTGKICRGLIIQGNDQAQIGPSLPSSGPWVFDLD